MITSLWYLQTLLTITIGVMIWRGVLDTTLCDQVVSDLQQIGGFSEYSGFLYQ